MTKYQFGLARIGSSEATLVIRLLDSKIYTLSSLAAAAKWDVRALPTGASAGLKLVLNWPFWSLALEAIVASARQELSPPVNDAISAWLPPIGGPLGPGKLICIGTNYHDHIEEMHAAAPSWPYAFLKSPRNTLVGSGSSVSLPRVAHQVDWEAELAVVIGQHGRNVAKSDALSIVAGYAPINDVSARDWISQAQLPTGIDWLIQKCIDGFAPMGPWVTPATFVSDPNNLAIRLTLNDAVMQDSNTSRFIYNVQQIIVHLSRFFELEPGDVIATGTPAGTGYGRRPQRFLKPGDVTVVDIEGLGSLTTAFVAPSA